VRCVCPDLSTGAVVKPVLYAYALLYNHRGDLPKSSPWWSRFVWICSPASFTL